MSGQAALNKSGLLKRRCSVTQIPDLREALAHAAVKEDEEAEAARRQARQQAAAERLADEAEQREAAQRAAEQRAEQETVVSLPSGEKRTELHDAIERQALKSTLAELKLRGAEEQQREESEEAERLRGAKARLTEQLARCEQRAELMHNMLLSRLVLAVTAAGPTNSHILYTAITLWERCVSIRRGRHSHAIFRILATNQAVELLRCFVVRWKCRLERSRYEELKLAALLHTNSQAESRLRNAAQRMRNAEIARCVIKWRANQTDALRAERLMHKVQRKGLRGFGNGCVCRSRVDGSTETCGQGSK